MLSGNVAGALDAAIVESADTSDVDAQERLVDILLTVRMPGRAVQLFGERVEAAPTNPDAHYLYARAVPDAERAQASYERALKLDPLHARSHMGMGAIHTARRDFDAAKAAYSRAVRIDRSLPEAWLGLIRTHLAVDRLDEAIETSRKAIAAVPASPEAYLTLSIIEPTTARATLELAVARAGQDPRVHAALADVLLDVGDGAGAVAAAGRSLAIDPTEPIALRALLFGTALVEETVDAEGVRALSEARLAGDLEAADTLARKYPRATPALLTRSQLRVQRGDVAGGIADLEAALALSPEEAEVLGQLGILKAQQGDHVAAAEFLKRAFAKRPWDAGLGRSTGIEIAKAGDSEVAVQLLAGLHQRMPYTTEVTIALADALLLAGERERAYQVILGAAEKKTDEQLIVALVAAATQVGRFEEAADILEEIGRDGANQGALTLAARLREKAADTQ